MGYPIVYTDGACPRNGGECPQAGYGIWWEPQCWRGYAPPEKARRLRGLQTNNRAEFTAVIEAIQDAIRFGCPGVVVKTDSRTVYNTLYFWLPQWKQYDWFTYGGRPVMNQDLIRKLDWLSKHIHIIIHHVKAHSGNYGNEYANKLAGKGVWMDYIWPY